MACSSRPRPLPGRMLPTRAVARMPAIAEQKPAKPNAIILVRSGLMPIAVAAALLPPTA